MLKQSQHTIVILVIWPDFISKYTKSFVKCYAVLRTVLETLSLALASHIEAQLRAVCLSYKCCKQVPIDTALELK